MAVSVTRDLKVQVHEDVNRVKLTDRQQELRAAIQRGEPKCLGLSQVMLGLMVIFYSLPLIYSEVTDVVTLGVPWWTGVTFIVAGSISIAVDKQCSITFVRLSVIACGATVLLSLVAVIIYSVDLYKYPQPACDKTVRDCGEEYSTKVPVIDSGADTELVHEDAYPNSYYLDDHHLSKADQVAEEKLGRGIKSILLFFTLVQAAISALLGWLLLRQRHIFKNYAALDKAASSCNDEERVTF